MPLSFNPHKLFFITVLFSVFLGYFFNSGLIAYGPLIVMALAVVLFELILEHKMHKKNAMAAFLWVPYVLWAGYIYISNPFEGRLLSSHLLSILLLPVFVLTFSRMLCGENKYSNYIFVYKSLMLFVFFQFIICIGQISTYTFGFGLPVSELHADRRMVTGTFTNSNDLAAVVLAVSFVILGLEKNFFKCDKFIFWIIAVVLLLVTGSRSAIVLSIILFVISKVRNIRNVIIYGSLFVLLFLVAIILIDKIDVETVARFTKRLESLQMVMQHGISADGSMTMRLGSYLHFLDKLPELGLGSGEVNNYFKYSIGADFNGQDLLFQNPHSLIIEIGYWLGYPGLFLFIVPIVFLLSYSSRKLALLVVFLLVSTIPSSILGNMVFFSVLIVSFFDYRDCNRKNISSRVIL